MTPTIEIRERHTGEVFHRLPLYEFLGMLDTCTPAANEFKFDDLQILLDGEEVLPSACGHA